MEKKAELMSTTVQYFQSDGTGISMKLVSGTKLQVEQ